MAAGSNARTSMEVAILHRTDCRAHWAPLKVLLLITREFHSMTWGKRVYEYNARFSFEGKSKVF